MSRIEEQPHNWPNYKLDEEIMIHSPLQDVQDTYNTRTYVYTYGYIPF